MLPAEATPVGPVPTLKRLGERHAYDSSAIDQLATVFIAARRARLQFLIGLHSRDEDLHFLSEVVLPANQVWVAESESQIVGFIAFAGEWVNHLYITPAAQRHGLGWRLLAIAKRQSPTLQLWVFTENEPAVRFYQRDGFRIVETTDGAANEARRPDARLQWTRPAADQ